MSKNLLNDNNNKLTDEVDTISKFFALASLTLCPPLFIVLLKNKYNTTIALLGFSFTKNYLLVSLIKIFI